MPKGCLMPIEIFQEFSEAKVSLKAKPVNESSKMAARL